MNHYHARVRTDGRFEFACEGRAGVRPVGYCAPHQTLTAAECDAQGIPRAYGTPPPSDLPERHHADGHATAAEAVACYRDYVLDVRLRLSPPTEYATQRWLCQAPGCGASTDGVATIDHGPSYRLCATHLTRAVVAALYPATEEIQRVASY